MTETVQELFDAYAPVLRNLSAEIGSNFAVMHTGGGCHAISAQMGDGTRILITDYNDGDLSLFERGGEAHGVTNGYMIGFSLPDSPWTGETESLVGDPTCCVQDLSKFVAFALSDYLRGNRHTIHTRQVTTTETYIDHINYGGRSKK